MPGNTLPDAILPDAKLRRPATHKPPPPDLVAMLRRHAEPLPHPAKATEFGACFDRFGDARAQDPGSGGRRHAEQKR